MAGPVGDIGELVILAVSLLILLSRTAIIEVGVIHRPDVSGNLFESKIYVLLIGCQILMQAINFQINFVNSIFHQLLFLLRFRPRSCSLL